MFCKNLGIGSHTILQFGKWLRRIFSEITDEKEVTDYSKWLDRECDSFMLKVSGVVKFTFSVLCFHVCVQ